MRHTKLRSGGRILVDQLLVHGVDHVFCVPGESYLAALDALHDADIAVTVCRNEGGACMMAEAYAKLTGRPGVCFVTRGPGATNSSPGIHIARQDSTPLLVFVGQVEKAMREREAFQEIDYRAAFGPLSKWATEIEDAERIPEIVARAFQTAANGRPGPVVVGLPEDVLTSKTMTDDARPYRIVGTAPTATDIEAFRDLLAHARNPVVIAGGSRWSDTAVAALVDFSVRLDLPVAVSFRRQSLFPGNHPNFIGDIGVGSNPDLVEFIASSDLVILLGGRLSELPSQSYTLLGIPAPRQRLVHVHPGIEELGRVYQADVGINAEPLAFLKAASGLQAPQRSQPAGDFRAMRESYELWNGTPTETPGRFNLGKVLKQLEAKLPGDAIITNGAGNYATWVHRFYRFNAFGTQLAPTSGSMGYGVPAAVAASRIDPKRKVVCFAGDGCFLMNGQEFATAVQYDLPIIVVVIDNGMYGTIRMHQEREYPDRITATTLRNPDFAAYARAFGGHGERVDRTEDFAAAFDRAAASGRPSIIHCLVDPEALTPARSLSAIREQARTKLAAAVS